MTAFLAVASSRPACLAELERRSAFFYPCALGFTVENGISLAQAWEGKDVLLPYLGFFGGTRFLSLVAHTRSPFAYAEYVAQICAKYGKKMHAHLSRQIPFAVFHENAHRLFFGNCYITEENGTLWLSSHEHLLVQSKRADFGFCSL